MMRGLDSLVVVATLVAGGASAEAQPRSAAPPIEARAGGFVARRLPTLPIVDDADWVAVEPVTGRPNGALDLAVNGVVAEPYTWRIEPAASASTGDVERYRHSFVRASGTPVVMEEMKSWAYVTPDGRYVFREVLTLLDVLAWRQYDLAAALKIPNYTSVLAISNDRRRLLIESRSCPYDCRPEIADYELSLPR